MNDDIKINIKMHLHQIGSIAYVARELALVLNQLGCDVKITDIPVDWNTAPLENVTMPAQAATLRRLADKRADTDCGSWNHVRFTGDLDLSDLSPGRNIFMYPWDFDPNHGDFAAVRTVNRSFDAAWMISNHTLNAYVNIGLYREKAYLVPHGVNPRHFHPDVPPKRFETRKCFKFLFVGLPIKRKGIDVLVPAFIEEFSAKDDVCLIVKTKAVLPEVLSGFQAMLSRIKPQKEQPEVLYILDEEPLHHMPSYFTGCDCFVFPTRGESFGLVLAEAMACGKPVITTRWSGPTDYCHHQNSYLIEYTFSEAQNTEIKELYLPEGTLWAEPDREQLKRSMRHVFEHRDEACEMGLRAHREIAAYWTWEEAAQKAIIAIRRMQAREEAGATSLGRSAENGNVSS